MRHIWIVDSSDVTMMVVRSAQCYLSAQSDEIYKLS